MWGEYNSARIYVNTERHFIVIAQAACAGVPAKEDIKTNSGDAAVTGEVCLTTGERPYMS